MNINERCYKKKSPEAIAYESTVAHYLLYSDKIDVILAREQFQAQIETELAVIAIHMQQEIETHEKMKFYVI